MDKQKLIGPIAIVLSFAVLFGVVGYILVSDTTDAPPEPTARVGQLWTYEATDTIVGMETTVDWGLVREGRTLWGTPEDQAVGEIYYVTIFLADGTALDFTIEVVG